VNDIPCNLQPRTPVISSASSSVMFKGTIQDLA
jgi:hypothetical protein